MQVQLQVVGRQKYEEAVDFYNDNFNNTDSVYMRILLRCWMFNASREADYSLDKEVQSFLSYKKAVKLTDLCAIITSRFIVTHDIGLSTPAQAISVLIHHYNEVE